MNVIRWLIGLGLIVLAFVGVFYPFFGANSAQDVVRITEIISSFSYIISFLIFGIIGTIGAFLCYYS